MRGFQIERNIAFSELPSRLVECPDPVPGPNEVVVDVYCAGLNPPPTTHRKAELPTKPAGAEFSGIVSLNSPIPSGCPFIPGKTRVFGAGQGAYSQKIKVDWHTVIEVPDTMSLEEASGLYVTMPTSYAGLVNRAQTKEGEWVLVHAAAGGVGLAAVQIAKALGAKVIATASQQKKLDVCKRYGADYVLDYTKEGWQKEVLKITSGHGADVIFDPVGLVVPTLKCIAWNGRIIVVGFAGGNIEKIPANLLLLKNCTAMGVHWGAYKKNEPSAVPAVWGALLELFKQKRVKGIVFDKVFEFAASFSSFLAVYIQGLTRISTFRGLESVPEGLRALGARETWGKAVVRVKMEEAKSKL
ncbi:SPOSA6832_04134, partial [Sporobolomyces salmonicolor]